MEEKDKVCSKPCPHCDGWHNCRHNPNYAMSQVRLDAIRNQPFTFGDTKGSHITWWEQERIELLAEIDRLRAAPPTSNTVFVHLTPREYRKLLRHRGRLRMRKIDNSPATPLFNYWFAWECIQDERRYLTHAGWQRETTRRAYRNGLERMRELRLTKLQSSPLPQQEA